MQWVFTHSYSKMMRPSQIGFYEFNLRACGNLHINWFMVGIIKMSGQTGNANHGDIFIPCKLIAPFEN